MKALAVIPARGGSKRVPRKNLRKLCDKPLIQWTIEAAQASGVPFVVSTEDYEIGKFSADLGAYVIRRPEDLASDTTSTGEVLAHALEYLLPDKQYDAVICLHPTSPIRDPAHIVQARDMLLSPSGRGVMSVREIRRKTHNTVYKDAYGTLVPVCDSPVYVLNASIYGVLRDYLLLQKNHVSAYPLPLIMDDAHSVDIDTEADFAVAEAYMRMR